MPPSPDSANNRRQRRFIKPPRCDPKRTGRASEARSASPGRLPWVTRVACRTSRRTCRDRLDDTAAPSRTPPVSLAVAWSSRGTRRVSPAIPRVAPSAASVGRSTPRDAQRTSPDAGNTSPVDPVTPPDDAGTSPDAPAISPVTPHRSSVAPRGPRDRHVASPSTPSTSPVRSNAPHDAIDEARNEFTDGRVTLNARRVTPTLSPFDHTALSPPVLAMSHCVISPTAITRGSTTPTSIVAPICTASFHPASRRCNVWHTPRFSLGQPIARRARDRLTRAGHSLARGARPSHEHATREAPCYERDHAPPG